MKRIAQQIWLEIRKDLILGRVSKKKIKKINTFLE